jgi:hypothetical protein
MNRHSGINVFDQFGFRETKPQSGKHTIGVCPFCGKEDHFYLNIESNNKAWDCKSCLKEGGFKTFIEKMVEFCADQLTPETAAPLCESRGLKYETFANLLIGYHPMTQQYIIPILNTQREILGIKLYDMKTLRVAAGCSSYMFGQCMTDFSRCNTVFLFEGEWDGAAWYEISTALGLNESIGWMALPSAGYNYKPDDLALLQGKNVYLFYDNDEAGQKGRDKAVNVLTPCVQAIYSIKWPHNKGKDDDDDKKLDIRKVYNTIQDPEKTYEYMWERIEQVEISAAIPTGPGGPIVPCEKVYDTYKKFLHIPDTTLLDIIFGTIVANKIPGDPVWMFIVAPPGATKTEPILPLEGHATIRVLDTLTPNTLISGAHPMNGEDPSLVPKLDGTVVIIKDFTSVLSLPSFECDEIFGLLRAGYEGKWSKPFGNGQWKKYNSRFGIIAAVTPVVDQFTEEHAALGERFLRWRNFVPTALHLRRPFLRRAMNNVGKEVQIRAELIELAHSVLNAQYDIIPAVPADIEERLMDLAELIAIMRGTVVRDKYEKTITHIPFVELGTRLSKQLLKLLLGIGMFRNVETITEYEYDIIKHVALSSIPYRLYRVMKEVYKAGANGAASLEVAKHVDLPSSTCQMLLENLCVLGALERTIDDNKLKYLVKEDVSEYIKNSKLLG